MTATMKKILLLVLSACACVAATLHAQDATFRSGDSFDLRISGVPADDQSTISGAYTVDNQGYFNLSYIGKVKAGGRTASEVQTLVERAYVDQGYFTHPTISLTIAPTARFVNVGGQVKSPGRIPYTADMTVFSAIGAAGDFTEFAKQNGVILMRGGKSTKIDCKKIRSDPSQDVRVLPGDIIQVPESPF